MADEKPPSQAAETLLLSSFPAPNSTKARASTGANDGTLILPSGGVPSVSASSVSESLSSYNENRSAQVLGQLTDQPVIPVDFRIGSVRFVRRLGAGNMGIVFLGHHDGLDRPVVVKTLNRRVELGADGEAALLRFREEARAVAQLSHQNIAQIFDVGSIDGIHYLVMEYIDGGSLKEHWEKRQPELPELVRILREIAGRPRCGAPPRHYSPRHQAR